jgi:hypothetical protein
LLDIYDRFLLVFGLFIGEALLKLTKQRAVGRIGESLFVRAKSVELEELSGIPCDLGEGKLFCFLPLLIAQRVKRGGFFKMTDVARQEVCLCEGDVELGSIGIL